MITKQQQEFIKGSKFGVLATCKDNKPRSCVAIVEGVDTQHVIFADVQMNATRDNLKSNPNVHVYFCDSEMSKRVVGDGIAEYKTGGDQFEEIRDRLAGDNLNVRGIIKIKLSSISDIQEV